MPVQQLTVGSRYRVRHTDEASYQEFRLVRDDDNSYTFGRWLTPAKGAISFVEVPKEPGDLLQIGEDSGGVNVVYVLSTGGGFVDRTPYLIASMSVSNTLKQKLKKEHLEKFREFEVVLES